MHSLIPGTNTKANVYLCGSQKMTQCGELQLPIMPTDAPLLSDQRASLQMSTPGHTFHHSLQTSPEPMCGEGTC